MEKNTFIAILLSFVFIIWWSYYQTKITKNINNQPIQDTVVKQNVPEIKEIAPQKDLKNIQEQDIIFETTKYKAVFTNKGAGIKHWFIKENGSKLVDLIQYQEYPGLSTFPDITYEIIYKSNQKISFLTKTNDGYEIVKTFQLSDDYLGLLTLEIKNTKRNINPIVPEILWYSGIGTDEKENQVRVVGLRSLKPNKLEKLKTKDYPLTDYKWIAIDNRYFLAAFLPSLNDGFSKVSIHKNGHKSALPYEISFIGNLENNDILKTFKMQFYIGPKGHSYLKTLKLDLEQTVDFGFFGFLGKIVLDALTYLYKLTGNYGWAIVLLTVALQIFLIPLTIKSFKASVAMKQLQPYIKELQIKYKQDPKRFNIEMMNMYKKYKVNPFGGCWPMLLQLPIFWALFTTLRNSYELRGANWIFWIKDLSAPDSLINISGIPINILPLFMGIGMFVQQKLMSATSDPAQAKIMYIMPIIFTILFWSFPSGLVLYWFVNNILTIIEQYIIMKFHKPLIIKET